MRFVFRADVVVLVVKSLDYPTGQERNNDEGDWDKARQDMCPIEVLTDWVRWRTGP